VLDNAKPEKKIFMVSYGSGAGSDAFVWKTTNKITAFQNKRKTQHQCISQQNEGKQTIDYVDYLKKTHKI